MLRARSSILRAAAAQARGARVQQPLQSAGRAQQPQLKLQQSRGLASSAGASSGGSGFSMYDVFFKTNARYVLFIVVGATVGEQVYSSAFDAMWNMNNRGNLYHQIDWSTWNSEYMGEDEDEDDEDDE